MQCRHHDCRTPTAALSTTWCFEVGHVAWTNATERKALWQPGGAEEGSCLCEGNRHLHLAYDEEDESLNEQTIFINILCLTVDKVCCCSVHRLWHLLKLLTPAYSIPWDALLCSAGKASRSSGCCSRWWCLGPLHAQRRTIPAHTIKTSHSFFYIVIIYMLPLPQDKKTKEKEYKHIFLQPTLTSTAAKSIW